MQNPTHYKYIIILLYSLKSTFLVRYFEISKHLNLINLIKQAVPKGW